MSLLYLYTLFLSEQGSGSTHSSFSNHIDIVLIIQPWGGVVSAGEWLQGLELSPGGGHGSLENPHGQRSLVGYIPWGRIE